MLDDAQLDDAHDVMAYMEWPDHVLGLWSLRYKVALMPSHPLMSSRQELYTVSRTLFRGTSYEEGRSHPLYMTIHGDTLHLFWSEGGGINSGRVVGCGVEAVRCRSDSGLRRE